jgi:hypothetical protein
VWPLRNCDKEPTSIGHTWGPAWAWYKYKMTICLSIRKCAPVCSSFVLDGEYIWKYRKTYDFSVLGNTPITLPIGWDRSKIPGFAIRGSMPNFHGLSAYVVMSHVAARFFEPQVSGIGAAPVGSEVFRIDHDEVFNQTTHLQYQPLEDRTVDRFQLALRYPRLCRNRVHSP